MNISSIHLYKYSLPLVKPLYVCGNKVDFREGLLLQIQTAQDYEGWGEIAPLPYLSSETLEESLEQIQSLKAFLLSEPIPNGVKKLNGKFATWLKAFHLKPSVQCGIEMAVLNLFTNIEKKPFLKIISDAGHDHVLINALLEGTKNRGARTGSAAP